MDYKSKMHMRQVINFIEVYICLLLIVSCNEVGLSTLDDVIAEPKSTIGSSTFVSASMALETANQFMKNNMGRAYTRSADHCVNINT